MKFQELECVRILEDHFNQRKGSIGTIVVAFTSPCEAYEVEFCDEKGRTTQMLTLLPDELELVLP